MSSIVEYKARAGVVPSEGQQFELAPAEAAMAKFSILMKGNMRPTIVSVIEGNLPNHEEFNVAMDKLVERHSVLRCKFVQLSAEPTAADSNIVLQFDSSIKIPVHYHESSLADSSYDGINNGWKAIWSDKIEKKPLALNEPVAQVDVISFHDSNKKAILLTCEHALCDGMSLSVLSHELLSILSNDDARLLPSQDIAFSAPLEILCAPSSPEHGQTRLNSFLAFPRPTDMARFAIKNPAAIPKDLVNTCSTFVSHAELSASETTELVALCRTHECTVTSIVGVAMMQAAAKSLVAADSGENKVEFVNGQEAIIALSCAADTRRLVTPPLSNDVLACHVSGVAAFLKTIDVTQEGADHLWSLAVEYKKHIAAVIAGEFPLFIGPFLSQAWSAPLMQTAPERKPLTTSISNWGISPVLSEYGSGSSQFKVHSVMPICTLTAFPFPGFLVNTAVGKLTVTLHTPSGSDGINDEVNSNVVADVMRILRSLLSASA